MNAGILLDIQQGSVASDGGGILTLGSGGELQVEGSSAAQPYVVPDGDGPFAGISVFSVTTVSATELSLGVTTSVPGMANSFSTILNQGTSSFSPSEGISVVETPTATALSSSESGQQASVTSSSAPTSALPNPSSSAKRSALNTPVSIITSTLAPSSWVPSTISRSFASSLASSSYTSVQSIVIASSSSFLSSSAFFTSSGVSIATPTYSSTAPSSTLNSQTSSQTIFAPINTNASNLNVDDPPFYVGVVLGTIAGIALLAALIAWLVRYKAKRRRAARIVVPWARFEGEDDGGLETGVNRSTVGATHLGSWEDLTHVQAWSPRGDRDVGEPRRSESYINGSTRGLHNHTAPGRILFSDKSFGALSASEGYSGPGLRPNRTSRQLPSHLMDESFAAQARREEAFRYTQYYGRPMPERIIKGRSKTFPCKSLPQNTGQGGLGSHRLWNLDEPRDPFLEDIGPLPTLGTPQKSEKDEVEQWASTVKASLVNIFNFVAANLSRASQMKVEDDRLTALPKRATRKSVRDVFRDEKLDGNKGPFRHDSALAIRSTLEAKADGSGVVHLHGSGEEISPRPSMVQPNPSFGDGESISTYDDRGLDFQRIRTADSQIPLIASSNPPPAFIRPEVHYYSKGSNENVNETQASRESSIYSTFPSRRRNRADTPFSSLSIRSQQTECVDSIVIEPSISRLPSTHSGCGSDYSRATLDAVVSRLLKDRHQGGKATVSVTLD